jgi:general secretion pathway protein H
MMRGHSEAFLVDTSSGSFRAGTGTAPRRIPGGVQVLLITATQEQVDEKIGGIRFFADGSSTGGGVRLVKGNNRDQVLVDWLTGRVSMGDGVHDAVR